MILLDTNVLPALMRDPADPAVAAWLDAQEPGQVWTTAVNVFEVRFGLARLAGGRRRQGLEEVFAALLREDLAGRAAPLDRAAAGAAGLPAARREAAGRTVDVRDTLIGVALARRALVATRNLRHYADLETGVVDPWAAKLG